MRNPNRPVAPKTPSERRQLARAAASKAKSKAAAALAATPPTPGTVHAPKLQSTASVTDDYGDDSTALVRSVVVGICSLCVAGVLLLSGMMLPKGTLGWQKQPDGSYRRSGVMDVVAMFKPGPIGGGVNAANGDVLAAQCRLATGVGLAMAGNKDGLSKAEAEGRRLAVADMCDQLPAAIDSVKDMAAELKEISR